MKINKKFKIEPYENGFLVVYPKYVFKFINLFGFRRKYVKIIGHEADFRKTKKDASALVFALKENYVKALKYCKQ